MRIVPSESGGIGRRARLRGVWLSRTGSSPVSRTRTSSDLFNGSLLFLFVRSIKVRKPMLQAVIPSLKDLWFREHLLADEDTMSYNHAWGGTISFSEEKWADWYDRWIVHHDHQRFYRYLEDDNGYVGEIAYRYDPEYNGHVASIIIEARFRGKGYGACGLELLCSAAKHNGIGVLYDDIAIDNTAVKLFLKQGFSEIYRTTEKIVLKKGFNIKK